jgi:lysyl-tRNA synthetase class 2
MSEADLRAERIKKLEALQAAGFEGYPATTDAHLSGTDFHRDFETLAAAGKQVTIVGRIMAKRGQGGIMFADLFDGTQKVQAVFQADLMPEKVFALFADTVDIGDFLQATGTVFLTKRGEKSLQATDWKMLSKSLLPLPSEHFGIKDEELKLRERYLGMLLDPETRGIIERRARFWNVVRAYYLEHGFMEVETPILETSPGGADARPFETHHNALDIDVSLRISLELWLKRLLVAGFPKVFEIGRIFRNEGQSREHLQDYTQVESYEAFSDMHAGMRFIQELYRRIAKDVYGKYTFDINGFTVDFAEEWPELDYCTLIKDKFGIDPLTCTEDEAIQAVRDAQIPVGEADTKAHGDDRRTLIQAERRVVAEIRVVDEPVTVVVSAKGWVRRISEASSPCAAARATRCGWASRGASASCGRTRPLGCASVRGSGTTPTAFSTRARIARTGSRVTASWRSSGNSAR